MIDEARTVPFLMNLALSSHDVVMEPIVRDMGLVAKHLHKRGEPIFNPKHPSRRIATKHYASVAHARGSDETDVSAWLDHAVSLINNRPALAGMIRAGIVEAMPRIGVMIHDPMPPPLRFDPSLVDAVTRLGARILIEDYNRENAEGLVPRVTWIG